MKNNITLHEANQTSIRSLKPHPKNARRGNLDLITESLATHGQYRPVVINQDGVILAGHHVVQAAKKLGWTQVATVTVTVNDAQAIKILLADNRTADLASYSEPQLLSLLESLPSLDATGYGAADITALDSIIHGDLDLDPDTSQKDEPDPLSPEVQVTIGPLFQFDLPRDIYEAWKDTHFPEMSRGKTINALKDMLDLPKPPKPEKMPPKIPGVTETVPVHMITCHPHNAREGDLGAVIESLQTNGQYRPIIVNKRTTNIIVGNHTYQAARSLGWDRIAVHYIDVDPEEETRILLIDNRTSDLATYDTNTLKQLLTDIRSYEGTGYSHQDAQEILTGGNPKPGPRPTGQTNIKIGEYGWRIATDTYDQWANGLDLEDIIQKLALPTGTAH